MHRITRSTLVGIVLYALAGTAGPARASTSCVALSRDGAEPPHVLEARERFAAHAPDVPGGWEQKAENARQNRMALAEGRISAQDAERGGGTAVAGNLFVPVLLTLYDDTDAPPYPRETLQDQLFGSPASGSMTQYYEEVSYGNLNLTGTVFDWRRVPLGWVEYTGFDNGLSGGGRELVLDAIVEHDATVDFGQFDNDGPDGIPNSGDDDGVVDVVVVTFPTAGGECGGASLEMWSHHHRLSAYGGVAFTNDPRTGGGIIMIDRFVVAPALACSGMVIQIGVYCHELGHALGIVDLYDTKSQPIYQGPSAGIGFWGLMGAGSWNTPSSPAHMTAWTKERLGWLSYLNITQDTNDLCLPPVETNPVAARVWTHGAAGSEYFLVENRQGLGFDAGGLPRPGLVIYHVDEDIYEDLKSHNRVNAYEAHKALDVECADATSADHTIDADDLDRNDNRGDAGDPWCVEVGDTDFDGTSIPDSRAYSGVQTKVAIKNIGRCDGGDGAPPGWVCADYVVGVPAPADLCIEDCAGDNCNHVATCGEYWATPNLWIDNDGDGTHDLPAPGFENRIWARFQNLGPDLAAGVAVDLYAAAGTMGLEWPDDADTFIGTATAGILVSGESTEESVTFVYPDLFDLLGHYCLGAVIDHQYDPVNSTAANLSNNIAQINSQVLIARAWGGAIAGGGCPGPFAETSKIYLRDGYNPLQKERHAIVRLGSPPDFDDYQIPDRWTLEILPHTGPFVLAPGVKDSITVKLSSPLAAHGETAHVPLTLWDVDEDRVIGGITLDCEIDCSEPAASRSGSAEWTEPPGDDVDAPTVLVEWDPVTTDVLGNPERVVRYEVFRSADDGLPYFPIAEVAVDAELAMPLFQWYDDLPRNHCPSEASYKVRAIDGAGAVGAFSNPFPLACAVSEVGEGGADAIELDLAASPNPFRGATTISFQTFRSGSMDLEIFNTQGERVREFSIGNLEAGRHQVEWDGRDDEGHEVGSGIYLCRIRAAGVSKSMKIVQSR